MQKLNKKKQNHTSHIALHTSQKGITLIALIITIIVMLILVGVTINVALNGGLFTKAEEATNQTQLASEKEQLMMAVIGAYDVKTGVDFANMELPETFEGSNGTYKSKATGKTYTVNQKTAEINEGRTNNIEYFGKIFEDEEMVWAIDYTNKILKIYTGEIGGELISDEDIPVEFILNYGKEFYIVENGERIDIGTGATNMILGDSDKYFIINSKGYFDMIEGEEGENLGFPLLVNFDITRLVEE